eukprot:scaffold478_cov409-Prasinococcus_capsulatus_cf.AAC.1
MRPPFAPDKACPKRPDASPLQRRSDAAAAAPAAAAAAAAAASASAGRPGCRPRSIARAGEGQTACARIQPIGTTPQRRPPAGGGCASAGLRPGERTNEQTDGRMDGWLAGWLAAAAAERARAQALASGGAPKPPLAPRVAAESP